MIFACYRFVGKLDDAVGITPFGLDPMNIAAATHEKIIEYLKEEYGKEVGREYFNKNECLKVEFERTFFDESYRSVYVIVPIFILDEIVELT
jgi:hypothetical protein